MIRVLAAVCAAVLAVGVAAAQDESAQAMRDSVVKIFTTFREPDLERPWTKAPPSEATGSGFVIEGQRVLTNAHMVEHASQIFIQPPKSADKLRARVAFVAYGIDLAVLEIVRESERNEFFGAHPPLPLDDELPAIGSTVQAIGYPLGGEQQSITEGIVSRVEFTGYYYNTAGLRVQVDTPLNRGNSGGPVVQNGQVVGVVFSGVERAENIGYVIPIEEVRAFLDDIADGSYEGRARSSLQATQTCENPQLRDRLGLSREQTGVVIAKEPRPEANLPFQRWDVLARIGEHNIDNAGLVTLDSGLRLGWPYMVPVLGDDGSVSVTVIRDGSEVELTMPVGVESRDVIQYLGGEYPDYFIYGPMVFTPVYAEHFFQLYTGYLASVGSPIATRASDWRKHEGEQLVVVAGSLLPHAITKGYEVNYYPTLHKVNGQEIKSLAHLVQTLRDLDTEFIEFEFYDQSQETLVFTRAEIETATEEILDDNGIREQMSPAMREHWPD